VVEQLCEDDRGKPQVATHRPHGAINDMSSITNTFAEGLYVNCKLYSVNYGKL